MASVVAPQNPDFGSMDKVHADFHVDQFQQKRQSLLSELRCLSGLPEILGGLQQETLYRLVIPEGRLLQQGTDGLFGGVIYNHKGIEQHARFAAAGPNLLAAAKAVGSQVLLVSIAMQLNNIEKMIEGLTLELHRDRIAELLSGVDQFHHAMDMNCREFRNAALLHAVQTLHVGLRKSIADLGARIAAAPDPADNFLDHFWYMGKGDSKTACATRAMRLAEESFQAVLVGIGTLAKCYAALDEPKAAGAVLREYLGLIDACNITLAAQKARLVEFRGDVAPQAVWEKFRSIRPLVGDHLEVLSTSGSGGDDAVEIEFKPSELQGASHGDRRPVP